MRDPLSRRVSLFALSTGTLLGSWAPATWAQQQQDDASQSPSPALQLVGSPQRVFPKRVARMGPDFKIIGDWHDVSPDDLLSPADGPPLALAFDCFEPDENGEPTDGNYFEDCGLGGGRWRHSCSERFNNPFCVNDMQLATGFGADPAQRVELGWGFCQGGQCYVAVFTADTFDDTCSGFAYDDYMGGLIFDMGDLFPHHYFYADVDLAALGESLELPGDGAGAYGIMLGEDYDDIFGIIAAHSAEPMLWGTKPLNPSEQGPIQWDDLNPPARGFTADECFDYGVLYDDTCPYPLGAMACFYAPRPAGSCYLELLVSPLRAGFSGTFSVQSLIPDVDAAVFFSFSSGSYVKNALGSGWCLALGLNLPEDPRNSVVCKMHLNGNGQAVKSVTMPPWSRGARVYFQAALRGTCPEACSSNLVVTTVK